MKEGCLTETIKYVMIIVMPKNMSTPAVSNIPQNSQFQNASYSF